jgi:hypothetical protein
MKIIESRSARAGLLWSTPYTFIHSLLCLGSVFIWFAVLYTTADMAKKIYCCRRKRVENFLAIRAFYLQGSICF